MFKNALCLIRVSDDYPWKDVNAGLEVAGYNATRNTGAKPDILVTWTPWKGNLADKLGSQYPNRWLVFENGYIPSINGVKYYTIGIGGYNGTERVIPDLGRQLVEPHSINHNPDGPILVIGQFGHHDTRYSMPLNWPETIITKIRQYTDRKIIFRPKLKYKKFRIPKIKESNVVIDGDTPLIEQLSIVHSVVTWNSPSISVKAILDGIPVFIDAPNCISKCSSIGDISEIEKPITQLKNQKQLIDNVSNSIWSISEIRNGIPFNQLQEYIQ